MAAILSICFVFLFPRRPSLGGGGGAGSHYLRPDGSSLYRRPGGVDLYLRP